jgi:hypothetical protein
MSERNFSALCQNTGNPGKGVSRPKRRDKHTALQADAFAGFPCVSTFTPYLARRSDGPPLFYVTQFYGLKLLTYYSNLKTINRGMVFCEAIIW